MTNSEYYNMLRDEGVSEAEAERMVDYRIAYQAAQYRLVKRGERHEPTDAEIEAILARM